MSIVLIVDNDDISNMSSHEFFSILCSYIIEINQVEHHTSHNAITNKLTLAFYVISQYFRCTRSNLDLVV